ncbi:MAG: restriction endonuclease [Chloroflexi bacterium]|nr:restriction endonuclease [Chloroflexota bacterium]
MSTTARHHAEWLSLLEISGPFLSLPVLLDAFPQGLDAVDPEHAAALRSAYEEWADNQGGLQPDPAIHTAWIRYVLSHILEIPPEFIAEGQAIPTGLRATIPEHHETITPDLIIRESGAKPKLLIQIYPATQGLEKSLPGHAWKASPATRMMELLYATEVRLGLVTNGEQWLLVQARRGESTGYISWYAALWLEERLTLRAFASLLGMYHFFGVPDEQMLPALLDASAKDQQEVTDQLGYQVRRAVEILVQAIDKADEDRGRNLLTHISASHLYEAALTVMMRLVFLLSAEERGLLLLGDPLYDQHYAISTLRAQLREMADQSGEELLERRYDAWCRLLATFRAVFGGIYHENLHLPAYGGSLFDPERFPFLEGRTKQSEPATQNSKLETSDPLAINNRTVLHLLDAVQLLQVKTPGGGPAQARRLSFRALDIEQIGNVYEGLLDHIAVRATEPILGLQGTKDREPEIPLARLEQFLGRSEQSAVSSQQSAVSSQQLPVPSLSISQSLSLSISPSLLSFLQDQTGRSPSALKNALAEGQKLIAAHQTNGEHRPLLTANWSLFTSHLRSACGNDEILYRRILPWAGLLRDDDLGYPTVILPGSVYVTTGTTRRATGTHYTPQTLTVPIVQHTLEPLVYIGPAEGWPREQWQLRTPAELLALKVCDMAMGSGAMLVQVDRYLAERLVEAWGRMAVSREPLAAGSEHHPLSTIRSPLSAGPDRVLMTPEGEVTDDAEKAIPADPEEQLRLARRLVADRCIYGVDKNPLAVEIAKLSLWLVTLDKNRPFTFLDHALKHGDSLIGADEAMFLRWSHTVLSQPQHATTMSLFDEMNRQALDEARQKRRALQAFTVQDVRDAEEKTRLLAEAEEAMRQIKVACDLLVGVQLLPDLNADQKEAVLGQAQLDYTAGREMEQDDARRALTAARQVDAFHWPFEFPEVFSNGGFSAFVGNPPFLGGLRISTMNGSAYLQYLRTAYPSSTGTADLCAFFFLQAFRNLRPQGTSGLIATNTIAQGDTRLTGLETILRQGGTIYDASTSTPWPGVAAVYVSIVHYVKGKHKGEKCLDDRRVEMISSLLDDVPTLGEPKPLLVNENKSFIGSYVLGKGFVLSPDEAQELVTKNPLNADVIFPYLNGDDLNTRPDQSPSRWVINFFDWPLQKAEGFPDCLNIIRRLVYPERQNNNRKAYRENWWHHGEKRPGLYQKIAPLKRVLVTALVSKYVSFVFQSTHIVFMNKLGVFPFDGDADFLILQSSLHTEWAWKYSSTLGNTTINYSPSDCFETFPFPLISNLQADSLSSLGSGYYNHRSQLLLSREEGLTLIYNRFHNPAETATDIVRLRELHVEMDNAIASAYGWSDLVLGHGFHETPQGLRYTLSEPARREVLTRLLHLNHQRHEEELRQGLHDSKKSAKSKKPTEKGIKNKRDGQMSLL